MSNPSRVLTSLDEVVKHLERRTPGAMHASPVSVLCSADGAPSHLAYDPEPADQSLDELDEENDLAWFTVSTPSCDRHGDRVIPAAFVPWMKYFEKNPRAFFAHKQHDKPIGSWRHPETGECTVQILEDRIRAGLAFHCLTDESRDVRELVFARELEMTSIGFLPHKAVVLGDAPEAREYADGDEIDFDEECQGLEFTEAELLEISVVPIGANREALAERLAKGLVKSLAVRKALAPYAPPKKAWSPGFTPPADALTPEERKVLVSPPFNYTDSQLKTLGAAAARSLLAPKGPPPAKTSPPPEEADPVRWNKSLSRKWDVKDQKLKPATLEYDFAAKHLGCKVKEIYERTVFVPSAKMGGFLCGWRDATADFTVLDLRNVTYRGTEAPPAYEKIRLNSKLSDDFLVEGLEFLEGPYPPAYRSNDSQRVVRLVVSRRPAWFGLSVTLYARRDDRSLALGLPEEAWRHAAEKYNFLKGEAFALSGEFLPRTEDAWSGLFLPESNESALKRTVAELNEKKESFTNRGTILMGPPGTGKTLSGRVVRNDADATFIWVSARDFHRSGAFGGFAYAFELAKELAPSVLFFEDVDNWLDSYSVDLLKTEMDGIERYSGVWTLLTTNFPEDLPEALIDRPGRFHDVLLFNLPDEPCRGRMLDAWLPGLPAEARAAAVESTKGQSGAHIFELCRFAKSLHASESTPLVDALAKAIEKTREQRELIGRTSSRRRGGGGSWKSFAVKSVGAYVSTRTIPSPMNTVAKGAVPYAKHPLADESASWDAAAERKKAGDDLAKLRSMCAYVEGEGETKAAYKLPHHTADGCKTVWAGVRAAMAALLGARGGLTGVSDSDKKKAYEHLSRHYAEFDKTPPEFHKSYSAEELDSLFGDLPPENPEQPLMADSAPNAKKKDDEALPPDDAKPGELDNHPVVKSLKDMASALKEMYDLHKETHGMVKEMHGRVCDDAPDGDPENKGRKDEEEEDDEDEEPVMGRKSSKKFAELEDALVALAGKVKDLNDKLFFHTGR